MKNQRIRIDWHIPLDKFSESFLIKDPIIDVFYNWNVNWHVARKLTGFFKQIVRGFNEVTRCFVL